MQRKHRFIAHLTGVLLATAIISSHLLAQGSPIGKGSWIISGSAGINSQHFDGNDQTVTTISIAPSAMYFVSPGVAVGGSLTFGHSSNPSSSSTTFGVGPRILYYFANQQAKTLPFVSAMIAPTSTSIDPKNSSAPNTSSHGLTVEGTAGLTHLIASHVGITGEAYYDHFSLSADVGSGHATQNSYAVGVRFGVTAFVF